MRENIHSVVLNEDKCTGCTNCMRRCPTEAIRVRDRKAIILKERCIDCGECIRVCPYNAQNAVTDDLDKLSNFDFNVAIPSTALYGQFGIETNMDKVFQGIKNLGFNYVFDEAYAADIATQVLRKIIKDENRPKPIISSLCPVVLRLIQVKFPSLIDNIINVESPMEIAARLARKEVMEKYNLRSKQIGIFYLTPCPAKATSIKQPIGIKESFLNGAISIKKIYGDLVRNVKAINNYDNFKKGSPKGIGWAKVSGQSYATGVENFITVDGIENVINILEEIELGKLNNVDYFEGLACVGGCVGGPLNVENPFIAKNRIRRLSENKREESTMDYKYAMELYDKGYITWTEKIYPRGIMKLDTNIEEAMKKMGRIEEIVNTLPGLDCGSCGAPTCYAHAEDVVRGYAKLEDCIFKLKEKL